jgi:competence protein ComEA
MKTWQSIFIGIILGLLSSSVILLIAAQPKGVPLELKPPPTPIPIIIQVSGEVIAPGVYALPTASRVLAAIEIAGGFTPEANIELVNLAKPLEDGEKIWVPAMVSRDEAIPPARTNNLQPKDGISFSPDYPLNINSASLLDLESLPGIGPTKAQWIIDYRLQNGPFQAIEDILNVEGIGEGTFNNLQKIIAVE